MMKINPICERAAYAVARIPYFSATLFGDNALLATLMLSMLGPVFQHADETGELRYAEMPHIFHTLVWVELIPAILLVPARAAGTVSGKKEQRTLDSLFGTTLSSWRTILGSLLQNLVSAGTFALPGLLVLLTASLFGGVSFANAVLLFLGILSSVALSGNLGPFFSVTNRTIAVAIVETYAAEALLLLVFFGILLLTESFGSAGTVVSRLTLFSPVNLMEDPLSHTIGLHDFAAPAENPFLQQGLTPAAFLKFLLMTLFLFAAVYAILPHRRKRKFIAERNLVR